MKFLSIICLVMSFQGIVFAAEDGGVGSRGGGSVVRNEKGELVPADLYFQSRNYKLPQYYLRKLSFKNYPGLIEEVKLQERFIENRARNLRALQIALDSLEIYETERLSGDDLLIVQQGFAPEQVSYTYVFREIDHDGTVGPRRRIVEVKPSLFKRLSRRNQALILLHERLHHEDIGDHEVISPLIQTFATLLPVRDRQHTGDMKPVSYAEFKASEKFEKLVRSLNHCDPDAFPRSECFPWPLNRQGGGVLAAMNPKEGISENWVGVDSAIQLGRTCQAKAPYHCYGEFKKNRVIDSFFEPNISYDGGKSDHGAQCSENRFESVRGAIEVECGNASQNVLKNIFSDAKSISYVLLMDEMMRDSRRVFYPKTTEFHQQLNNHIEGVRLENSNLIVRGSGNNVSRLDISSTNGEEMEFAIGSSNVVSDLKIEGKSSECSWRFDSCRANVQIKDRNQISNVILKIDDRRGESTMPILDSDCKISDVTLDRFSSPESIQCKKH